MHRYAYRADVVDVRADGSARFRIDLGFCLYVDRVLTVVDPPEMSPGDQLHLLVTHEDDGRVVVRVHDRSHWRSLRLWRYTGTLIRVIDGDTLDARVTIYPGIEIEERFRRCRICAPEIFCRRHDDPEYLRGIAARDFVIDRFRDTGGRMFLATSRRGKWRRWLAEVWLNGPTLRLRDQVFRAGHAVLWFQVPSKPPRSTHEPILRDDALRRQLTLHAHSAGLSADELVRRAIDHYLRSDPSVSGGRWASGRDGAVRYFSTLPG